MHVLPTSVARAHETPALVMPRPVVKVDEVAELLGYRSARSFYNRRRELEAAGFPRKLPGINGWSRAAIMRWIENGGEAPAPEPEPEVDELAARYGR